MHPAIASYPSVASYGGRLRSGISGRQRCAPQGIAWSIPEAPVTFLPVEGGGRHGGWMGDGSDGMFAGEEKF